MTTFNATTECVDGHTHITIYAVTGTDEGVGRADVTVGGLAPIRYDGGITPGEKIVEFDSYGNTSIGSIHVRGDYYDLAGAYRNQSDQDVDWNEIPTCVVVTTTTTPETTTTVVVTTVPGETTTTPVVTVPTTAPHGTLPPTGKGINGPMAGGGVLAIAVGVAAVIAGCRRQFAHITD